MGTGFTHRVLAEAAKGWFLADRRDQETDDPVAFYDEHGLNQQRAYEIVCLMVGSDAGEIQGSRRRKRNCRRPARKAVREIISNAAYSWDFLLKPHLRAPDQPETKIDVVYGEAKGRLEIAAKAIRSIGLLEAVAQHTAEAFVWPAPFTIGNAILRLPQRALGLSDSQTHRVLRTGRRLRGALSRLWRSAGRRREERVPQERGPEEEVEVIYGVAERARSARRSILSKVVRGSSSMKA